MSHARKFKREQAKAMYKKAVKGIPRSQRIPFSKVYKSLLAHEARSDAEMGDSDKAAELGSETDLLSDFVLTDKKTEEKKDAPNTPSVEQDIIL